MRPSVAPSNVIQFIAVLMIAGGLKLYYSLASVNDLYWVLAPTTFFVELITGETFTFESFAGYMSEDHSFLIAAACSGVNFLITAFLMLSVSRLWKKRTEPLSLGLIPAALAAAYLATLVANTIRIAIALHIHRMEEPMVWVNPEQLHRFEGIFVYFGFLLLLYNLIEGLDEANELRSKRRIFGLRRSILPLLIYWVTTIGVPLANGAYHQGASFWEHSAFIFITSLVLMLPLSVINGLRIKYRT